MLLILLGHRISRLIDVDRELQLHSEATTLNHPWCLSVRLTLCVLPPACRYDPLLSVDIALAKVVRKSANSFSLKPYYDKFIQELFVKYAHTFWNTDCALLQTIPVHYWIRYTKILREKVSVEFARISERSGISAENFLLVGRLAIFYEELSFDISKPESDYFFLPDKMRRKTIPAILSMAKYAESPFSKLPTPIIFSIVNYFIHAERTTASLKSYAAQNTVNASPSFQVSFCFHFQAISTLQN